MRYFIKTEQELIDEFGKNWNKSIRPNWLKDSEMSYLHGKEVSSKIFDNKIEKNSIYHSSYIEFDGWHISTKFIKIEDDSINIKQVPKELISFIRDITQRD